MIDDMDEGFDEFELSDEVESSEPKNEEKVSKNHQPSESGNHKQLDIDGALAAIAIFLPPLLSVLFFLVAWQAVKNVGNGEINPLNIILSLIFSGMFIWAIIDGIKNIFKKGKKAVKRVTKSSNTSIKEQQKPMSKASDAKEISTAIKYYKKLYDNGVITKKEFEEKKRQLLDS